MSFRYDISFLRAIAVIIVVFFHYKVPFFNGGFIGVDLFFVISGYLMTNIILKKIETQSFILIDFYKRRFNRILPALIIMMLGVLITVFFLYFPTDFKQTSLNSLFSSLFISNYYYLFNSGYFNPSSQFNLLLHTWSLSVEWQFYMIYPVFLIFTKNIYIKNRNKFKNLYLTLTILSFLLVVIFNNFLPSSYNKISFFSFTHRAWEMMIGGLAFLYGSFFQKNISSSSKKKLTIFSFLGIIISFMFLTEDNVWPSSLTLIPVLSSFLIISLNEDYNLYKNKKIEYISNISYSLYLWHWPVYVLFTYFDYKGFLVVLLVMILSLILSITTFELIEKKTKRLTFKKVFIPTSLIFIFSLIASFLPLNSFLFSTEVISLTNFKSSYESTRKKQFNSSICHNTSKINYNECLVLKENKKNILLIGDSHAGQYSLSFRKKIDKKKYNFIEHTVVGAFPLLNAIGSKRPSKQFKELIENYIIPNKNKISQIIISCHWLTYPTSGGYESDTELANDINKTITFFEGHGIKTLILGQTEKYNMNFSKTQAFRIINNSKRTYLDNKSFELNVSLKKNIPQKNYVDLFLRREFDHYNKNTITPYMFDQNHLTVYGSDQVIDYLIDKKII